MPPQDFAINQNGDRIKYRPGEGCAEGLWSVFASSDFPTCLRRQGRTSYLLRRSGYIFAHHLCGIPYPYTQMVYVWYAQVAFNDARCPAWMEHSLSILQDLHLGWLRVCVSNAHLFDLLIHNMPICKPNSRNGAQTRVNPDAVYSVSFARSAAAGNAVP